MIGSNRSRYEQGPNWRMAEIFRTSQLTREAIHGRRRMSVCLVRVGSSYNMLLLVSALPNFV